MRKEREKKRSYTRSILGSEEKSGRVPSRRGSPER